MRCANIEDCFYEINAYCSGETTGYPLLVNVENYNDFQAILLRLEADTNNQCIYVSNCVRPNGLPVIEDAFEKISDTGTYVLVGAAQAMKLKGEFASSQMVGNAFGYSISGHADILLCHCQKIMEPYLLRDPRCDRRSILLEGTSSPLPQIKLVKDETTCVGFKPLCGINGLLSYMEHMSDDKIELHPALTVVTGFNPNLFSNSMYAVGEGMGVYGALCEKYPDLRLTIESNGTPAEWAWLLQEMQHHKTFSAYISSLFGSTVGLAEHISGTFAKPDTNAFWILWLGMKIFGVATNSYLSKILSLSNTCADFEGVLYNAILDVAYDASEFKTYYNERKSLLEKLPENLPLINAYCDQIGRHGKNCVWYLTSASDREEYELVKSFSIYEYSDAEIIAILGHGFPDLALYMQPVVVDVINTKLPDTNNDLRNVYTLYFKHYKMQKIKNRIYEEFLEQVNEQAYTRPFMKLQPRSSLLSKIDKDNAGIFFFDALGVEYLAYIQAKCEAYGLVSEISVGRCELPSITAANKEFEKTCQGIKKISDLDDLKHHSLIYDYTECPYPIHVFRELEIIDKELRRIQSLLAQGTMQKAVILADHGASRLAVLYGRESDSKIELQEKSVHSGRCCKNSEDPHLAQASYEDGYAVLANYERFKGSRAANLEVHGGASLEEVLVPIISLTRKPDSITYCFVEPVVKYKVGQATKVTLFSNMPMKATRIQVNDIFYEGTFVGDKKHAEFTMPEIKRTNSYEARIYEGEKNVGVTLEFSIERATKQKNLFGF